MKRAEVIALLQAHRAEIEAFGARSLSLFGSVARDEARAGSDVDLLVEFDGPTTFRGHMGLLLYLEQLLGCSVDLATPAMLRPGWAEGIQDDLLRVA